MTWRNLLIALLVLHLLPIWIVTYLPMQDGPAHIYNSKIFFESFDRSNYQIRQVYDFGYQLYPNMLTHLMLGALQQIMPGIIAEKIVVSLIVALLPLSMLYLLNSIERGRGVMCLLGFTFAYHNLFHIGFYNFSMSVPLCLFALGWWWRYKDDFTLPRLTGFYALSLLTYVSHFAGFMALVLTLSIVGGWSVLLRSLKALVRVRRGEWRADVRAIAIWSLGFVGLMIPLWAAGWDYNYRFYRPEGDGYHSMRELKEVFFETLTLTSYSDWTTWGVRWKNAHGAPLFTWPEALLWFMVGVAALTVLYRIWPLRSIRPLRFRLRLLEERDGILLACGALVYLYFTLPWSRNKGGWVNDRLYIIAFVLAWAWFGRFHKFVNVAVAVGLIFFSVLHTTSITTDYWKLQPYLHEAVAAVDKIEPHSTVNWEVDDSFRPKEYPKGIQLVTPWLHVMSHYGRAKDVALFSNYEAGNPYFLTGWGEAQKREPDYIVTFGVPPDQGRVRQYLGGYEIIYQSANLEPKTYVNVLKRKTVAPDLKSWTTLPDGRQALRLRMRDRGPGGDGVQRVPRERLFSSGGFGWVTSVPRQEWVSARRENRPTFPDLVGDRRDRAFRVDLPNGKYNVTCHFASLDDRPGDERRGAYQTGVIANDRRVGRVEVLPGSDPQTIKYTVEVTNGRLVQVFYTTWKGAPDPEPADPAHSNKRPQPRKLIFWGLSGIEIEQASPPPTTQKSN